MILLAPFGRQTPLIISGKFGSELAENTMIFTFWTLNTIEICHNQDRITTIQELSLGKGEEKRSSRKAMRSMRSRPMFWTYVVMCQNAT